MQNSENISSSKLSTEESKYSSCHNHDYGICSKVSDTSGRISKCSQPIIFPVFLPAMPFDSMFKYICTFGVFFNATVSLWFKLKVFFTKC